MTGPPGLDGSTDVREPARDLFWELHDASHYSCPGCGASGDEVTSFHVHHLDGDRTNHSRDNLVALCPSCHLGDEHDRRLPDSATDPPSVYGTNPPSVGDTSPGE